MSLFHLHILFYTILTYLIVENEHEPMIKLFKMSVQMMRGNIWRLVKLNISLFTCFTWPIAVLIGHIGWEEYSYFLEIISTNLLGIITIIIQFIILGYFIPYGLTALANFYLIVKEEYKLELAEKTRKA
ncbi:MAG: DUF975 family protein [Culicoidibacterales bacterium]